MTSGPCACWRGRRSRRAFATRSATKPSNARQKRLYCPQTPRLGNSAQGERGATLRKWQQVFCSPPVYMQVMGLLERPLLAHGHHHDQVGQILGHGQYDETCSQHQRLLDNGALLAPKLLAAINTVLVEAGHTVLGHRPSKLNVRPGGQQRVPDAVDSLR